ncbi:MAG: hypothetical protein ACYDEY_00540 [Acidimicrobiales bacterium]
MNGLVLQVEIDSGEKLAGCVGISGSSTMLAFEGWIAFMAAMDRLRREAGLLSQQDSGLAGTSQSVSEEHGSSDEHDGHEPGTSNERQDRSSY